MNVDYETLYSLVANQESGGKSYDDQGNLITSPRGAQGKMQVMPGTNSDPGFGVQPAMDQTENERIRVGKDYLKAMIARYGDVNKGLAAYNWGPGNLDKVLAQTTGDSWVDMLPPETQQYVSRVGSQYNGTSSPKLTAAFITSKGQPDFTKATTRAQALSQYGAGNPTSGAIPNADFENQFPVAPGVDQPAMYPQDVAREQQYQQGTNFSESFYDSLVNNTVTAGLVQMATATAPDPNFNVLSEDNKRAMVNAGIYGNDQLADYVTGARNSQEFTERLQLAQERKDYMQRFANTEGWRGASAVAGQLVGGMADPVAVIASLGAGAAVAAVRNAATISRLASVSRAALGGAVENAAIGAFVDNENNQRFSWGNLMEQGITGAALGAVGGLFVREGGVAPDGSIATPESLPILSAAAAAAQEVVHGQTARAYDNGFRTDGPVVGLRDDSLPTEAADIPNGPLYMGMQNPLVREGAETLPADRPTALGDTLVALEEPQGLPRASFSQRLGYEPAPTLADQRYRALHDSGVVVELQTADDLARLSDFQRRFGQDIPADAKAVYLPQEDRVYVFRDRITPEEAADPTGLIMHEVGVHFGLERLVGSERFNKLMDRFEKLAATDENVRKAWDRVPADTPSYLRAEEALAYLVEKNPRLSLLSGFVADVRNWLRENIPMFRRMEVSTNDIIRLVQGSVQNARKYGRTSRDELFPYVWHGSPTAGIESLKTEFIGTGEGNAAFGFGHYVSSEKATAIDYRNKESIRRGKSPEEGGLYQLRVQTELGKLLDWEAPVEGQPISFALKGIIDVRPSETGGELYNRLAKQLGSQKAASELLDQAGVHGIRYSTGRTRGQDIRNSNFVLFDDRHLSMEARFSRAAAPAQAQRLPLTAREQRIADALDAVGETLDPAAAETALRGQQWLAARPEWMKKGEQWAFSPGVTLSASQSRVARIAGSLLFENSLGSGARHSTVSIMYEQLQRGYRDQFLMAIQPDMIAMMTPMEKARYSYLDGAKAAVERISTQVAEERLAHRMAIQAGTEFKSTAPEPIKRMAKAMDDQVDKMVKDGTAVGNEYAENVKASGWVGFMPQVWRWEKFADANRSDPAAWNALRRNFTQQYIEKNVDPVLAKLRDKGPVQPEEVQAIRDRLIEQVDHQVNTRLAESIRDPESRTSLDVGKFETMAAELLTENFRGLAVTDSVATDFRKLLGDHVRDRTRTEFDLLREVDGVRLLDYVEHDVVSTVQHAAHRFAGQNAMAKAGFKEYSDFESLITLAQKDGASAADVEQLAFAGRAYGFLPMKAQDHPVLAALRNFVYAATMGKLGIANLADAAAMNTAVGVQGMFRALGYSFRGETDLYKSLSNRAAGLLGQDYRIHAMTADVLPNGKALTGTGASLLRVSQKAAQLTSWLNGSNFVQKMLHKGFLPILAEDLTNAIRGKEGGMSLRRMADGGLTGEDVARIRKQLDLYEAGRKEGDAFQWSKWDDQQAADKFIEAMHRITYQTFQRTMVGEAAAWRSESALGSLVGQFHTFGITSMEKQLGRNLAINDMNTYTALAVGMAWSSLLFYARMQVNMIGMTPEQRKKYEKDNLTPVKITNGVLTYFNMSGIAADIGGMGEVLFGGNSYQGGSGPIAAFGYLGNISKAANSFGNLVTGQTEHPGKEARNIIRIVPGGNSVAGTYFSNQLRGE